MFVTHFFIFPKISLLNLFPSLVAVPSVAVPPCWSTDLFYLSFCCCRCWACLFVCLFSNINPFLLPGEPAQNNLELEGNSIAAASGGCQLVMRTISRCPCPWRPEPCRVVTWQLVPMLRCGTDTFHIFHHLIRHFFGYPLSKQGVSIIWMLILDPRDRSREDKFSKPLHCTPSPSQHQQYSVPVLLIPDWERGLLF